MEQAATVPTDPPPPRAGADELYTVRDACAALRISAVTLYKLIGEGELAVVKIGRSTRLRRVDVEAFVARHRDQAGKPPRARRSPTR